MLFFYQLYKNKNYLQFQSFSFSFSFGFSFFYFLFDLDKMHPYLTLSTTFFILVWLIKIFFFLLKQEPSFYLYSILTFCLLAHFLIGKPNHHLIASLKMINLSLTKIYLFLFKLIQIKN